MILYSVQCSHGHVFDEWFDNSSDYDAKAAAHEIACPDCGDHDIGKAIMAPRVGKGAAEPPSCPMGGCQGGNCAFANDF
jgi:hypothetical protein